MFLSVTSNKSSMWRHSVSSRSLTPTTTSVCAHTSKNNIFWNKLTLLFSRDALDWSKMTVKTFIMLQKIISQINAALLNFLFICESWKIKYITVSTKILCSTTVFNIDNNQKCFLSSKSAYYYDFWRSCDTEDWSNDAENTALITEIN